MVFKGGGGRQTAANGGQIGGEEAKDDREVIGRCAISDRCAFLSAPASECDCCCLRGRGGLVLLARRPLDRIGDHFRLTIRRAVGRFVVRRAKSVDRSMCRWAVGLERRPPFGLPPLSGRSEVDHFRPRRRAALCPITHLGQLEPLDGRFSW